MNILTKEEFLLKKKGLIKKIKLGAVFIHPTDTIYGIGCSVLHSDAVKKVREIKKRSTMPFSVLAPSKEWIYDNCEVNPKIKKWINKLPGPYTLILTLKNKKAIVPGVNDNKETIGVRIPEHWFSDFVKELGHPIITTSANVKGGNFMTDIKDMNPGVKSAMDFIIYEGAKKGRPSTLVNLSKQAQEVIKR